MPVPSLPFDRMRGMLGDVLVRDERRLRASKASIYLTSGEIPPEQYPELAIQALRNECLRTYLKDCSPWWRVDMSEKRGLVVGAIARTVAQIVLFISYSPASSQLDIAPPPSVAVARAFG